MPKARATFTYSISKKYIYHDHDLSSSRSPPSVYLLFLCLLHCVRRLLDATQRYHTLSFVMPSLRRTFSSPSVRSSPYPTAFSNSSAHGSARVNGHPYRRSSGSETSGRRVLADLEWWRVIDGQHDGEAEQESEDRDQDQDSIPEPVASTGDHLSLVEDAGVDRPSTPVNWLFQSPSDTVEVRVVTAARYQAPI